MSTGGRQSLLRFIAVGALNTGVGVLTIAIANRIFAAGPYLANALGFTAGILVGYELNRRWTFGSSRSVLFTAPRYLLVFAVSYAINLGVLAVLLRVGALHAMFAQVVAIGSYSVAFFVLCRFVVFANGKQITSAR